MFEEKTVLIVDDSKVMQKQVAKNFEKLNMKIIGFANSGLEALEMLNSKKPDLVSIDIIMPEMHGIELYKKIQNQFPKQDIIFISALANESIENSFEDIEAFHFVNKPVDQKKLEHSLMKIFKIDPPPTKPKQKELKKDIPVP